MSTVLIRDVKYMDQSGDLMLIADKVDNFYPQGCPYSADKEYAGDGCILFPSLIDGHVHLREPGQEYKEDIFTGLKAALGGGFGHILAMANTDPVNDHAAITKFILEKARGFYPGGPYLYPVGALTRGLAGKELAPLAELTQAGCVAFSNDGQPVLDSSVFRRAVEYASDLKRIVIDHCEDKTLTGETCINEGFLSASLGFDGTPPPAESVHVARDILLAQYIDLPIHLAHISTRQSVELIEWAKNKSVPITAETCPHYLLWDESIIDSFDPMAKVNPPLRSPDDVSALRQAVRTGVIDNIVTDHAPHAGFEKDQPFSSAPNGISGLDTFFSLIYSLVPEVLTLEDVHRLCVKRPAEIYGIKCSNLQCGEYADFFLFDPEKRWKVEPDALLSQGKNTPCRGQTLSGRVQQHFLSGKIQFSRK